MLVILHISELSTVLHCSVLNTDDSINWYSYPNDDNLLICIAKNLLTCQRNVVQQSWDKTHNDRFVTAAGWLMVHGSLSLSKGAIRRLSGCLWCLWMNANEFYSVSCLWMFMSNVVALPLHKCACMCASSSSMHQIFSPLEFFFFQALGIHGKKYCLVLYSSWDMQNSVVFDGNE